MSLYKTIGKYDPEYLLADPNGGEKIAISVEPGNGTVKRGTVMYRKATGMYAPASAAEIVATNDLVVIDETIDTAAVATIADDAAAYRMGRLITDRVLTADGNPVTEAEAIVLRQQGIRLDRMNDWSREETVFDNTKE